MIAVIADVHGNFPALRAVLSDLEQFGCRQIISLGDVAGYYCLINECLDAFREHKILNLLGNHDHYLLSGSNCPRSGSASSCLAYQAKIISPANLSWLAGSCRGGHQSGDSSYVHGGWNDPVDEYLYHVSGRYFAQLAPGYFFSGHTHVQVLAEFGSKTYCNPGSVGQPRDGDPRAAYALFDGRRIELRRVEYAVRETIAAMEQAGFPRYYSENLETGLQIGGKKSEITVEQAS